MKIYVASSWRNQHQPFVVETLRRLGYEVYDFRNPAPGDHGFHWSEIDEEWQDWTPEAYRRALNHPIAESGFAADLAALTSCDVCVLVLPCGRSAHAEHFWHMGRGKPGVIYLPEPIEPELMYKLGACRICVGLDEVYVAIGAIGRELAVAAAKEKPCQCLS